MHYCCVLDNKIQNINFCIFINNKMIMIIKILYISKISIMQKYKPSFDDYNKVMANVDKPKISKPLMTKYEFDQVISIRANQLALGAQAFVDVFDQKIKSNMELRQIALRELQEGKLPFIIKRPLPNNKYEYYRIKDLDLTAVQYMMR
jgi:DNA-directed RNA polymerase subunit K/omega